MVIKTLVLFSAVAYSTFLLEAAFGYPLSPVDSYLSEYAAADNPQRWWFAGADLLSSALLLIALVLIFRKRSGGWRRAQWDRAQWMIAGGLLAMAFFTVVDSFFPMPCAESLSSCPPAGIDIHLVASTLVSLSVLVVAAGLLKCLRSASWWQKLPPVLFLLTCVLIVGAVIFDWPVGIIQRVQVLSISMMLLCVPHALDPRTPSKTPDKGTR